MAETHSHTCHGRLIKIPNINSDTTCHPFTVLEINKKKEEAETKGITSCKKPLIYHILIETQYRSNIPTTITVIWCRPDLQNLRTRSLHKALKIVETIIQNS